MKMITGTPWFAIALVAVLSFPAIGQNIQWAKFSENPIMSGAGLWDNHVGAPCVLFNQDSSRYEMWFQGFNSDRPFYIGFATSPDGIHWGEYQYPVLEPGGAGEWDAGTVEYHCVIREDSGYKMWYSSFRDMSSPGYLGLATSVDGINWQKYSGNPVLSPGTDSWEAGGPYTCAVIPFEGGYKMWYGAFNAEFTFGQIGLATSADGIAWERDTEHNPVLDTAATWGKQVVMSPYVVRVHDLLYMYYFGRDLGRTNPGIGQAVSPDFGVTWTKHADNPILVPSSNSWDATYIEPGSVIVRDAVLWMYYVGATDPLSRNPWKIGLATLATAVETERHGIPETFWLDQNHPNPFNPTTTIEYELPQKSHVSLRVFNLLGQEVALLVDEAQNPGHKSVQFNAAELPSGVYLYRLTAGDFVATKKLVLVK